MRIMQNKDFDNWVLDEELIEEVLCDRKRSGPRDGIDRLNEDRRLAHLCGPHYKQSATPHQSSNNINK